MEKDVREVDVRKVSPNLRSIFASQSIEELCRSIGSEGQREPIEIWLAGDSFRILDGEKRWRACRRLGWRRIKAVITEISAAE